MTARLRPILLLLPLAIALTMAFQNCAQSFENTLAQNVQGKGNGGNGGGYDGKPGTYVLADLGGECSVAVPSGQVAAKQVIVVDDRGRLTRTVQNCRPLSVPQDIESSAIEFSSLQGDTFVTGGRVFQKANLQQGAVDRSRLTQYLCAWDRDIGRAELKLQTVITHLGDDELSGVSEGAEGEASSGEPGVSSPDPSLATSSQLVTVLIEDQLANEAAELATTDETPGSTSGDEPDPYIKGLLRVFETAPNASRQVEVSGTFFADRAAQNPAVRVDGQQQSGVRCWMTF